MKKFVTVIVMIVMAIQFSAIADVEPYGGYAEVSFFEFIDNATVTDVTYYGGTAYQKVWFDNGWHIIAECDEDIDNSKEATIHVYDETYWIVETTTITHDDQGEQEFWDLLYCIYNGEL